MQTDLAENLQEFNSIETERNAIYLLTRLANKLGAAGEWGKKGENEEDWPSGKKWNNKKRPSGHRLATRLSRNRRSNRSSSRLPGEEAANCHALPEVENRREKREFQGGGGCLAGGAKTYCSQCTERKYCIQIRFILNLTLVQGNHYPNSLSLEQFNIIIF